jgi:hypothetical protein
MNNKLEVKFKNEDIKKLAILFENSKIVLNNTDFDTGIEKIDKVIFNHRSIKNGDVVKLQNFSLDKDNEYLLATNLNRVKSEIKFAKEVIKNSSEYANEVIKEACNTIYSTNNKKDIMLIVDSDVLSKEILFDILKIDKDIFNFKEEELFALLKKLKLNTKEYIELAQKLKDRYTPDTLINIFEKLSNKDENAMESYLYVLLIFEMVDKVKDILETSEDEDLLIFKAYLSLKDNKKDYDLDKFLLGLL